ncbi:MAG: glutamate--tRNA ligase [Chloroflexi bacterium UTCFX4]|jgi:glutamyl-tRNA synthetase|nr:MAG: glutamate--tRNA ligase [Chloroflexi bacterium UTCFX4]
MTTIRVRYAPSPTGAPHIGNLRTALFNWLWARHNDGKFILRVEDTDQAREVDNGLELIMESLRFLGMDWDEGPDIGGAYGPYHQSERLAIYKKYADELIEKGAAYYCYCTPDELKQMRQEQEARGEPTRYDRRCRYLTAEQRAEREAKGLPRVVRLAVPLEGSTTLPDFIHGDITIPNADVDDQVLMKSDGFPTYHMAVVVDDHLMEITHVMRGDEWISSFPKHILLYNAFGWTPPQFGHMPVVLGPDKKKLSKRHGATSITQFRDEGYLVEALVNFMALLGWAYDGERELFSRDELIQAFTLDHIHSSPAVFDRTKLDWMNGYYIRGLETGDLAERLLPFLTRAGIEADLETVKKIAPLVQERLKRLDEFPQLVDFIFQDEISYDPKLLIGNKMNAADSLNALRHAGEVLDNFASFDDEHALEHELRAASEKLGLKPAQFFGILRVAVTGKTVTPPLVGTMKVMGKEKVMERVGRALRLLEGMLGD